MPGYLALLHGGTQPRLLCRDPHVARGVTVTSVISAVVSESPHCGNQNSKGFSLKLVTKCLLSLVLQLLSHSVDCLYEAFFPDYVKHVQMFAIDD